jgi:hypothetical protein
MRNGSAEDVTAEGKGMSLVEEKGREKETKRLEGEKRRKGNRDRYMKDPQR